MNRRWVQVILVAVGSMVVLGQLVALAFFDLSTGSWLSGTVIGLDLLVFGGANLLVAWHAGPSGAARWKQGGLGLVAVTAGIAEGLLGIQFFSLGWWLLVLWVLSALLIGILLPGSDLEKAARLAAFGFSSVLVLSAGTGHIDGLTGFLIALGWSILGAMGAVAIGAAAHAIRARREPVARSN